MEQRGRIPVVIIISSQSQIPLYQRGGCYGVANAFGPSLQLTGGLHFTFFNCHCKFFLQPFNAFVGLSILLSPDHSFIECLAIGNN